MVSGDNVSLNDFFYKNYVMSPYNRNYDLEGYLNQTVTVTHNGWNETYRSDEIIGRLGEPLKKSMEFKKSEEEKSDVEETFKKNPLIYIGGVVSLKSGGPVMTVSSIYEDRKSQVASCIWFEKEKDNYIKKEDRFNTLCLKLVDEDGNNLIPKSKLLLEI